MSIQDFYYDIKGSKKDKNNELNSLYKKPQSEKGDNMPKTQVFNAHIFYQCDLLFMPDDKGYKYICVMVDCYDGKIDAEPLKNKDSESVLKAIKSIFNRGILKQPFIITFDSGSEFKGEVKKYMDKNNILVKYANTGRHRQLAMVERSNQKIGTILFQRMTAQELLTGEKNTMWIDDLKGLVDVLNNNRKKPLEEKDISNDVLVTKENGNLIPINTV